MVSFVNKGRCGNFLFQAATAIGYATRHDLDFSIPTQTKNPFWNPIYFPYLSSVQFNDKLTRITVEEKTHEYHDIAFDDTWRSCNIFLDGYWQSYQYFDFCRPKVLGLFGLPYAAKDGLVSIHVRRGDYLLYHPHINPLVPRVYFLEAIEHFKAKGYKHFKVFSDDIGWCRKEFALSHYFGASFIYSEGRSILEDLADMSGCEHQIMSNSTYSWWGAWLNQNPAKEVICPHEDNYYGPANKHMNVSTLYPPDWQRIKYAA